MKLASLKAGRGGRLVVVSSDGTRMSDAAAIAPTLQAALDDWDQLEAPLNALAAQLDGDPSTGQAFDPMTAASPLPRAYQWADGSAYVNHVALVRRARGVDMPESFWHDPLMYQGGSDSFLAPHEDIPFIDHSYGLDFEGEIAVVTGDVPMGIDAVAARDYVRLVMLVNDVSLRGLIAPELAKGFGFFQSKPSSAFAPLAVTPESLGAQWQNGKLMATVYCTLNGQVFGCPSAGEDMTFDFGQLIAHAARTRPLTAGTIIGSGTVSNRDADGGPGQPVASGGRGYCCIAEQRMVETIENGDASTDFLKPGDHIHIEACDRQGRSIFGAVDQHVTVVA